MIGHYILAYLGTLTTVFMFSMLMDFLKQEKLRPSIVRSRVIPVQDNIDQEFFEKDEDVSIINEPENIEPENDNITFSDNIFDDEPVRQIESSELSFSNTKTGDALSGALDSGLSLAEEDNIHTVLHTNSVFNLSSIIAQKDSVVKEINLEFEEDLSEFS